MLIPPLIVAVLLYAASVFLPERWRRTNAVLVALAWLIHGTVLALEMLAPHGIRVGFATMISSALWLSVAAYWIESRSLSMDGMRYLLLPCATIAAILPAFFIGKLITLDQHPAFFPLHVTIAMLAYGALTVAVFHAVLMALQESWLHRSPNRTRLTWLSNVLEHLPPLLRMEKLMFHFIGAGFVLLSLTIASGLFNQEWLNLRSPWDHKTLFTLLSWTLFGVLLAGRRWRGWRGKLATRLTLAGFAALLLAYVGSRFVLEVVLQRGLS